MTAYGRNIDTATEDIALAEFKDAVRALRAEGYGWSRIIKRVKKLRAKERGQKWCRVCEGSGKVGTPAGNWCWCTACENGRPWLGKS